MTRLSSLAYFFFRADVFAGLRLDAAFRLTTFFALLRRFTALRFLAGPTSRRARRTAVRAAPVTALAAEFAAPAAVPTALPAIDLAPATPVLAASLIASCVVVMMLRFLVIRPALWCNEFSENAS